MAVKPIPEGYHTLTPAITVRGAAEAIEFYKRAFGAEEVSRMPDADGKRLMHAELRIGDSVLMLSDEFPDMESSKAPQSLGGTTTTLHLAVEDADAAFQRALDAGAKVSMPLENMFWGDRYGQVTDPFGHEWSIGTHVEDVTPEEMQKRVAAFAAAPA